jgi:hypothetical protein
MKLGVSVLVGVCLAMFLAMFFRPPGGAVNAQVAADPVFVGAGDIARCSSSGDEATAKLLAGISGTVFTTGDNAYPSGTTNDFDNCYDNRKLNLETGEYEIFSASRPAWWGQYKARTMPTPGNHEYFTANASGYFGYFGAVAGDPSRGYYSYDLGDWHMVALNSMCDKVGGCEASDPMVDWLKRDLAANPNSCTLAYFHHPVFSSGSVHNGIDTKMKPSWEALYAAGADVVVNGHSHNYERFAPQTSNGIADPDLGIRQFIVGTGGGAFHDFGTIQPNSEVRNSGTFGVLKLTLHASSYDWEFKPVAGKTFTDSGSGQCHDAPTNSDTTAPVVQPPQQAFPTGATLGTSTIPTKLTWSATDEGGSIASYQLQRSTNGGSFTNVSLASATSTTKTLQLSPGSTYQFRVRATDSAGNSSDWATGPAFLVDAQQENSDAIVQTGSWTQQALTSAYGGGVEYAKAKGSAAQFTFTGHDVAWVTTKAPDRGKATVSVDGVVVKTVDLYASTAQFKKMVFSQSNLDPTVSHTIAVQVLGTKNSASSDTRVDIDAFVVLR